MAHPVYCLPVFQLHHEKNLLFKCLIMDWCYKADLDQYISSTYKKKKKLLQWLSNCEVAQINNQAKISKLYGLLQEV